MDTPPPQKTRPRGIPPLQRRRVGEHDLIDEITSTAAKIAEARDWNGEPATLLNGLGDHRLKGTAHVIRVVRQRLERDARELARHKA